MSRRTRAAFVWASASLMVMLGAATALLFLVSGASWEQVYRGYFVPTETVSGREVHWARTSYSKVEIHDDGARPLGLEVALLAPPTAPAHGMQVLISVNDLPIKRVQVAKQWTLVPIVVPPRTARSPLSLQFDTGPPPGGPQGLGVGPIAIGATAVAGPRIVATAFGGLAGALLWLLTPMADVLSAGRGATVRAVATHARFGVVALAVLLLVPARLELLSTLTHLILQLALLALPGWWILTFLLRPRVGAMTADHVALLSVPITTVLVGLLLIVLQLTGAPNLAFTGVVIVLYGAILATLASDRATRVALVRFVVDYRHVWLLSLLVPLAAMTFLSVGLGRAEDLHEWTRVAYRGLHQLPVDSDLSWRMSETWRGHLEPNALFFSIWTIGDRGPVYGMLHSFFYRALEPEAARYVDYARLGAVLNALYVGPLFLWTVRRCRDARLATAVVVLVALNPWFVLNVYYTWPKLLSAAFFLSALVVLWDEEHPGVYHYIVAGGLFGLSILSHAAHALSFPVFVLFTAAFYVRSWPGLGRVLLLPAMIVVVQLPWLVYKQLYSPETFNIFTMSYLDGDRLGGYGEPVLDNLKTFMETYPLAVQIRVRLDQIANLWWNGIAFGEIARFWYGSASGQVLYNREFFQPLHSAGILWLVLLPLAAVIELARTVLRGWGTGIRRLMSTLRQRVRAAGGTQAMLVLAFAAASLSLNALTQWRTPLTHTMPYGETLLVATVGAYALRRLGSVYWLIALGAVMARQAFYFVESSRTSALRLPSIDTHGMHFWAVCVVIILLGYALSTVARDPVAEV